MAFDTSILDAALARRRVANEQERQAVLVKTMRLLDEFAPAYGIETAYLFGSLITPGRFTPHSDIDIAVEQVNPECFCEAISEFSRYLGRGVDLVELDKCHFAHRIREKGVLWERTT